MCVITDALQKLALRQEKAEREGRKFMEAPTPLKPSRALSSDSGRQERPREAIEEDNLLLSKIYSIAISANSPKADFEMVIRLSEELKFSPLDDVLQNTPWRHLLRLHFPEATGDAGRPETENSPSPVANQPRAPGKPASLSPEAREFFPKTPAPSCKALVRFGTAPPPPPPAFGRGVMILAPAHCSSSRLPTPPFATTKTVAGFVADRPYDGNGDGLCRGQSMPSQSAGIPRRHTVPPYPTRSCYYPSDLPVAGSSNTELRSTPAPKPVKEMTSPDLSNLQAGLEKVQGALSLMQDAGCDEALQSLKRREIRRLEMEKAKAEYAGEGESWATQLGKDVKKSEGVKEEMNKYKEELKMRSAEERAKRDSPPRKGKEQGDGNE